MPILGCSPGWKATAQFIAVSGLVSSESKQNGVQSGRPLQALIHSKEQSNTFVGLVPQDSEKKLEYYPKWSSVMVFHLYYTS